MNNQFWYYASRVSLWFNKIAWKVYSFSEKLRTAIMNIWMHP